MARIVVRPNGCWEWQGARSKGGYGQISHEGRVLYVHRVAYEAVHGPIPEGKQIDHLCRVRHCCRPAHLEAVSPRENSLRGNGPTAVNARKVTCPEGHDFTIESGGSRRCLVCKNEWRRAREAAA